MELILSFKTGDKYENRIAKSGEHVYGGRTREQFGTVKAILRIVNITLAIRPHPFSQIMLECYCLECCSSRQDKELHNVST